MYDHRPWQFMIDWADSRSWDRDAAVYICRSRGLICVLLYAALEYVRAKDLSTF